MVGQDGQLSPNWGTIKPCRFLVEGDKIPFKHSLRSFPPPVHLVFLFYLENRCSKNMVFLLSTEGKKWSLHYQYTQIRGKMWGKV